MKRPLVLVLLAMSLVIATVATIAWATDWDGPDRNRTQTIRVVGEDGKPLPPDTTVIVEADRGWGPGFPFGLFFFPIFLLFGFLVLARFASGGRGWSGPGGHRGPPPGWFEQMHLNAHEAEWNKTAKPAPDDAG
jgi:hypothetical protein